MSLTELPITLRRIVFAGRKLVLVDDEHSDSDGVLDLSDYTLDGDVRVAVDPTSTKLADVSFTNDLTNGLVYAYLTAAACTAIEAGAVDTDAAGRRIAYFDIKATPTAGEAEQWYAGTLPVSKVVTP